MDCVLVIYSKQYISFAYKETIVRDLFQDKALLEKLGVGYIYKYIYKKLKILK